jgi:hypothetical protein
MTFSETSTPLQVPLIITAKLLLIHASTGTV